MKVFFALLLISAMPLSSVNDHHDEGLELVCMMVHRASNSCHFNFKKNGERFRYIDAGCRNKTKKEEVIKKVNEGSLALAREWKMECPKASEGSKKTPHPGF